MSEFTIVATRGGLIESRHRVSAVVVDTGAAVIASAGDAELQTFWRSAAKPFQLLPLLAAGGIERFQLDAEMLALACGSHNGEPVHREVGARWLAAVGLVESELACAGHPSLWPRLAQEMIRDNVIPTPLWSNCSGKHAGMLALATLRNWPRAGYERLGHAVQQEVEAVVSEWTGITAPQLAWGVDGCTAAAVALPLSAMARAYALLGTSTDRHAAAVRDAMMTQPYMVAGAERLDTILMRAWPGRIIVKIGAEGVYCASLPGLGLGLALKIEDGDMKCAGLALVAVLRAIVTRLAPTGEWSFDQFEGWQHPPIRDTHGQATGHWDVVGGLTFAE